MIISRRRFEDEVAERVNEIMRRQYVSTELDRVREDAFREIRRLNECLDMTRAQVEALKAQVAEYRHERVSSC